MAAALRADPNQPLDRAFTLRNAEPFLLEREYHRLLQGDGPRSYIFPRACFSALDSSRVCSEAGHWRYQDDSRHRTLATSPVGGYEYRYLRENMHAVDFGLEASGYSGPLSFYLDARMFSEMHEDPFHASFDREFVERQDEEASGAVAYTSYSRFRTNLSYDWSWGRLTAARDAAHWGPGLFTNLVFHQDAVPFNQLTFTTYLGPLSVQSLYGQLALDTNWAYDTSSDFRSVYAHRYELRAGRNLVFGISEQLILHKHEAPFAFIPIIPLYVAKAGEKERLNNGNIAGDFSWRLPGWGAVYSEFLIDDMQSPTALFNDKWGNKWAWMAGFHLVRELRGRPAGLVAEYARVEPWVYTHYLPRTSQTANFNFPLGNQQGPNSQTLIAKAYVRDKTWYAGLAVEALWKGTDLGSSVLDLHPDNVEKKVFLLGVEEPELGVSPYVSYAWGPVRLYAQVRMRSRMEWVVGSQASY